MNDLEDVVTSPGFAIVVAACWTIVVAVVTWLFASNSGFTAGLAEGRRRYFKDAATERRRWREEEAAQRRVGDIQRSLDRLDEGNAAGLAAAVDDEPRRAPLPWWSR